MRIFLLLIVSASLALAGPRGSFDALSVTAATEYAATSGATDKLNICRFGFYVRQWRLWNNAVIWLLRSSQNAGTGTTLYSLGGWGEANGTLTNGPTWGASGITFDGSDDNIAISGAGDFFRNQNAGWLVGVAKDTNRTGGDTGHNVAFFTNNLNGARASVLTRSSSNNVFGVGGRRQDADTFVTSVNSASGSDFAWIEGRFDWAGGTLTAVVNGATQTSSNFSSGGGFTSNTSSASVLLGTNATDTGRFPGVISLVIASRTLPTLAQAEQIRALYKSTLGQGLGLN